jgi:hypothetical protein
MSALLIVLHLQRYKKLYKLLLKYCFLLRYTSNAGVIKWIGPMNTIK